MISIKSIKSIVCERCGNDFWDTCGSIADCTNCGFERPFHTRQARTDKMSPAQEKMVEFARVHIFENDSNGYPEAHEYKRFEVKLMDWGKVEILTEVGSKTDEGTMAAILCRTRRHLFVGRKGGLTLCNPARFVKDKEGHSKRIPKKGYVKGPRALFCVTI